MTPNLPAITKITKPGIYEKLPGAIYHGLCTPQPALSASFIITAMTDPNGIARAWFKSPMNPAYKRVQKREFDIGEATHLLYLEPDRFLDSIVVIDDFEYRTDSSKSRRTNAWVDGKVPLLGMDNPKTEKPSEFRMIQDMRRAMRNDLKLPFLTAPEFAKEAFQNGRSELSMFWTHPVLGIWNKLRMDYLILRPDQPQDVIVDYKTAALGGKEIGSYAYDMSWHIRAAHYLRGYKEVTGRSADYWYVWQEKVEPYFVHVNKLRFDHIISGDEICLRASWEFEQCLRTGIWPSNCNNAEVVSFPGWAESRIQRDHDRGRWAVPSELSMRMLGHDRPS